MKSYFSESCCDFLRKILNRNPKQRLGVNGAQEIKMHSFFCEINWKELE